MKNRGIIVFLTVIVTLLCLYYLSFTFVSNRVQKEAIKYAQTETGTDFSKKQAYLDSVWNEPVYNLFGADFTYKDIKETELSLGLDLQGGMHVTLEVSPVDIIKGKSGQSEDKDFLEALQMAGQKQASSQENFVDLFYKSFKELSPNRKLYEIFANSANQGVISRKSTDSEIVKILKTEVDQAIDRSFNILRTRVDRFGTSQPNIQPITGTNRIQIQLPGVENKARVHKLLQGVAKLEFWEVVNFTEEQLYQSMISINNRLAEEDQAKGGDKSADTTSLNLQQPEVDELDALQDDSAETDSLTAVSGDTSELASADSADSSLDSLAQDTGESQFFKMISFPNGSVLLKDTVKVNRILARLMHGDLKGMLPSNIKFLWDAKANTFEGKPDEYLWLYAIRVPRNKKALLSGELVSDARQSYDENMNPAVSMSMNSRGAKEWKRITSELINHRVAIVLDDYVRSAPNIRVVIPNGQSEISGNFTIEEAQDLANILKAGSLPARTRIVEEAVVGPSLGKEAQRQGILSIVAGLIVVVLFMLAYYAKGGIVANVALLFNIFFILGILAQLNSALTLPGIAGIVLTIGMSIDANVLIFERIREELRNGGSLLASISSGYDKAFSSIVDANITTFITGMILFMLGQGPVKGFAITLMIGIGCSFFTAVYITRVIISWMTAKGEKSKVSFAFPYSSSLLTNLKIDFLSKRKIAYMISGSIIVVGMILIVAEGGLNYGVDFTGGRSYVVAFNNPVVPSDFKVALTKSFEEAGTEVTTYDASNVVKITTSYMVEQESTESDEKVESMLIKGLEEKTGQKYIQDAKMIDDGHFSIIGSSKVGATIADDIKKASAESIIFSLIAIFLYILIRFKRWQFSLGAIIALFHDTLFVLSAFAIARLFGIAFEVDQVFIAAMLTIIGYSINDTVVVFDRIRENLALKPHEKMIDTFNMSINDTFSRTLITSVTTLIVVLILLIFGGEVLRGFSFALVVGIVVGTYSSIYIATPTVIDLTKKSLVSKGDN